MKDKEKERKYYCKGRGGKITLSGGGFHAPFECQEESRENKSVEERKGKERERKLESNERVKKSRKGYR